MRRSVVILLAVFALNAGSPSEAFTQLLSDRFFIEARIRTALYTGDRGLQNVTGLEWLVESMGPGTELSLGYRWSESFDVVGQFSRGVYPGITSNSSNLTHLDPRVSDNKRTSIVMEARYRLLPFGKYVPSLSAGIGITSGSVNGERKTGFGPVLGIGLARPLGPIVLFSQIQHLLVYPNTALDAAGSGSSPDALTSFSTGIRYHFRKKTARLGRVKMSAPGSLNTGEEGVFTITTDLDPVDYSVRWDFGDGTTSSGYTVKHTFVEEGLFLVKAEATRNRQSVTIETSVEIATTVEEVSIVSISAVPQSARVGDVISFSPLVRGGEVSCEWEFGDGSTATGCDTNHIYEQAGTYQASLTASNARYFDTSARSIVIKENACDEIPTLKRVFFAAHSSELTLEMRQLLRDNFSTTIPCTDRIMEVNGFAFDTERNASNLAEQRARVVIQYYLNLGVSSQKVNLGMVNVQNMERYSDLAWTGRKASTNLANR